MFDALRSLLDDPTFKSQVDHHIKTLNANEKILHQGEQHACIYLIIKGTVRIMVSGDEVEGKANVRPGVAELGPEDVFGEFGLFDDSPASADVMTVTETELIEMDIKSFQVFLEANPQVGYKIFLEMLKSLVTRLRHADKKIVNLYAWGIKAHQIDKYLE